MYRLTPNRVEIKPRKGFSAEDENVIFTTFKKHAGDDYEIELVYVDKFEPGKNGKRNLFLNS